VEKRNFPLYEFAAEALRTNYRQAFGRGLNVRQDGYGLNCLVAHTVQARIGELDSMNLNTARRANASRYVECSYLPGWYTE
jgi:hypothetical protein